MSESVTVLNQNEADRRLLLKLQHRLLRTAPVPEQQPLETEDDRMLALAFCFAPMGLAFLYLLLFSIFVLR